MKDSRPFRSFRSPAPCSGQSLLLPGKPHRRAPDATEAPSADAAAEVAAPAAEAAAAAVQADAPAVAKQAAPATEAAPASDAPAATPVTEQRLRRLQPRRQPPCRRPGAGKAWSCSSARASSPARAIKFKMREGETELGKLGSGNSRRGQRRAGRTRVRRALEGQGPRPTSSGSRRDLLLRRLDQHGLDGRPAEPGPSDAGAFEAALIGKMKKAKRRSPPGDGSAAPGTRMPRLLPGIRAFWPAWRARGASAILARLAASAAFHCHFRGDLECSSSSTDCIWRWSARPSPSFTA